MATEKTTQLREAFKLALSMVLFYWLALWMNWEMPKYGALAIVLVSLGTTGASLQKSMMRLVGTTVGLAIGMLVLALFAQDRWFTLLVLSTYYVVIGYFLQGSRYGYAWFVAGFVAPLVWATTYGKVDNAFHYATFRYLETTAGILIYTAVTILLWPQRSGDQLDRQGDDLWAALRQLSGLYRGQLEDGNVSEEAPALRNRLAGATTRMLATLQAAYADTPSVIERKRAWETLRVNMRAHCDALELWRESIDDVRRLDLKRLLPDLDAALDTLDRRLARIQDLWRTRAGGGPADGSHDDGPLLKPPALKVDRDAGAELSHFDRAALLGFVQQIHTLDRTGRELLRTMRVLAGLDRVRALDDLVLPPDLFKPTGWDPARLVNALFPALCFVAAYFFWIYFDPPTGPSMVTLAGTISLSLLMTPMRAIALLPVMLGVMWIVVAPIYFLVMPALDTGFELLTLVFVYTLVCSLIGARKPILKLPTLLLFVMMVNITNQQSYSFPGLVDGGMMVLLAITVIAVVQQLLWAVRPEQELLSAVRRFFHGCARITGSLGAHRPDRSRGRAMRKRYYESMVLPAPRRLQAIEKKLDYTLFPDNGKEKVQQLLDALQSIALRLQALELAYERVARRSIEWGEPLVVLGRHVGERVQRLFEKWSRLEPVDVLDEREALQDLAQGLQGQLEATAKRTDADELDDRAMADLYAMVGSARGLVRAAAATQHAASRINWDQWAEARF